MTSRPDMLELLTSREKHFSLAQALYNDADCFALDLEGVFRRQWLFAGVEAEIPKPGDYVTVSIGKDSIILVRDRAGAVRGFHNICRHRGSQLCDAARGHLSAIVCPYHLWTYDLNGRLRSAERMHEAFDPAGLDLLPVHVEAVCGLIYICLADDPPGFSGYRQALEYHLTAYRLEKAKLAHVVHVPIKGNWKLVLENSRECFHCPIGHPELHRSFVTVYKPPYPQALAGIDALWDRCRESGLSFGESGDADPQFHIARLPLREGCLSITMDGTPAVKRRFAGIPEGAFGSVGWAHFPTSFNHVLSDYAFHVRMLPLGPEESVLSAWWLVDAAAEEGRDYDLAALIKVWDETNLQDRDLIERNQRGVDGSGYRPGPYSQESELGVIAFVEWYCGVMTDFLRGPERRIARVA